MNIFDNRKILRNLRNECPEYGIVVELYKTVKKLLLPGKYAVIVNYDHNCKWGVCLSSVLYVEQERDYFRLVSDTFPNKPWERCWDYQNIILIPMSDPNCFKDLSEEMSRIIIKVKKKFPKYANGDIYDREEKSWKAGEG